MMEVVLIIFKNFFCIFKSILIVIILFILTDSLELFCSYVCKSRYLRNLNDFFEII